MMQKRRIKGERVRDNEKWQPVLKCLLFAYLLTIGLLFILAFMLYQFALSKSVVSACIIGIYVISCFFSGLMIGKVLEHKKFVWGIMMGSLYFAVLVIVSLIVNQRIENALMNLVTSYIICAGSGMLGGMVS